MIKIFIEDETNRFKRGNMVEPVFNEFFVDNINEAKIRWLSAVLQSKEFYVYSGGEQIGANVPDTRAYFNNIENGDKNG